MNTQTPPQSRIPKELPEELISRVAEKSFEASMMLANSSIGELTKDLPVERFMTRDLINARPEDTAEAIRNCMKERGFRHMLVCEKDPDGVERLKGVVSDRDVVQRNKEQAAQFMSNRPRYVHPTTGMMQAAAVMVSCRISCLPVVDEEEHDRLLGLVTLTDVMLGLNCLLPVMEAIADQLTLLQQEEESRPEKTIESVEAAVTRELRS